MYSIVLNARSKVPNRKIIAYLSLFGWILKTFYYAVGEKNLPNWSEFLQSSSLSLHDYFRSLRNDYLPRFHHHADDFLQYAPAAVMLGMKTFGVEGRSS